MGEITKVNIMAASMSRRLVKSLKKKINTEFTDFFVHVNWLTDFS